MTNKELPCPDSIPSQTGSSLTENETAIKGNLPVLPQENLSTNKESLLPNFLQSQTSSPLTQNEKANLKVIQNHIEKLRPQLAEQEFVDALACFFYQHRGIFIHSLKLDQHLKVLTDRAKQFRMQNKSLNFKFTPLESKIQEQFNISNQSLDDYAEDFVNYLVTHPKVTNSNLVNGRTIRDVIDDHIKGNDNMNTKKLFKPGQDYSIDDIKDGCKLGKFETEIRFAGENDLLIMLPDSKLILCVEIKRHMNCHSSDSQTKVSSKIDRNMKSASIQLNKNAKFISSRHGAILSPDWIFVKVCAISPTFNEKENICRNCHRFILTSDIVKTPGGLEKWWKETRLGDRAMKFNDMEKADSYNQFQLFFHRLVCLSSVRVVPDPFHTWSQIQGNNPHHMSAGHTKANQDARIHYSTGIVDIENILHRSHDAYKVLFFNKDQYSLLMADTLHHVVFICDFGSGSSIRYGYFNHQY